MLVDVHFSLSVLVEGVGTLSSPPIDTISFAVPTRRYCSFDISTNRCKICFAVLEDSVVLASPLIQFSYLPVLNLKQC